MSERKPQSLANHGRLDPWFHLVLLPLSALTLLASLYYLFRHRHQAAPHLLAMLSILVLVALFRIRPYALKVQDRVIRLEERLRLTALLPEPLRARIPELTEEQLIALRFASDGEVAALVEMTLKENLTQAEIKKRIQNWRPDHWRV